MSEENSPLRPWIDPEIEARIVALVLGEASDFEREELERMIAEDRDLAAYRDRIEATHGLLETIGHEGEAAMAGGDSDWKLPATAQAELLAAIKGEPAVVGDDATPAPAATPIPPAEPRGFRLRKTLAIAAAIIGLAAIGALLAPSYNRSVDLTLARENFGDSSDDFISYSRNYSPPPMLATDGLVAQAANSANDSFSELSSASLTSADSRERARLALLAMNDSFSTEFAAGESLLKERTKSLGRQEAGEVSDGLAVIEAMDAYAIQGNGVRSSDVKMSGLADEPGVQLSGDFDNGMGGSHLSERSRDEIRRESGQTRYYRLLAESNKDLEMPASNELARVTVVSEPEPPSEDDEFQREFRGGAERLRDFRYAGSEASEGREKEIEELEDLAALEAKTFSGASTVAEDMKEEAAKGTDEGGDMPNFSSTALFDPQPGAIRSDQEADRPSVSLAKKSAESAAGEESEVTRLNATNDELSMLSFVDSDLDLDLAYADADRRGGVMQRGQTAVNESKIDAMDVNVGGDIRLAVTSDAEVTVSPEEKAPLLGDLPVVGSLFRTAKDEESVDHRWWDSGTRVPATPTPTPTAGKVVIRLQELAEATAREQTVRLARPEKWAEQLGAGGYDTTRGFVAGTKVRAIDVSSGGGGTVEAGASEGVVKGRGIVAANGGTDGGRISLQAEDALVMVDGSAVQWDGITSPGNEAIVEAGSVISANGSTDSRQIVVVSDGQAMAGPSSFDVSGTTGSGGASIPVGGSYAGKSDSGIDSAAPGMGGGNDDFSVDLNLSPEVVEFDGAINYGTPILPAKPSPVTGVADKAPAPAEADSRRMTWAVPAPRGNVLSDFANYQAEPEPVSDAAASQAMPKPKPSPESAPSSRSMGVVAVDGYGKSSDSVIRREVLIRPAVEKEEMELKKRGNDSDAIALHGSVRDLQTTTTGSASSMDDDVDYNKAVAVTAVPDAAESLGESPQKVGSRFGSTLVEAAPLQRPDIAGNEAAPHWGFVVQEGSSPVRLEVGQELTKQAEQNNEVAPADAGLTDEDAKIHVTTRFVEIDEEESEALGFDWLLEQPGSKDVRNMGGGDKDAEGSWYDSISVDAVADRESSDYLLSTVQQEDLSSASITLGNRSGGFAVTDDSIDGLIASSAGTAAGAPNTASQDFGISGIRPDAWYGQTVKGFVVDEANPFPVTPATPTAFEIDSAATTNFESSSEFIYPTEYDPPEPPLAITRTQGLVKTEVPSALAETAAEDEPFSTFSLHVSDVSFKLAQAALAKGEWPDAKRIRIEEFVNAFDYGDPMPSQADKVACQMEQTIHPFLQQRNLLRISMRTAAVGRSGATPLRLTLLLDHSGSMERHDRQETVRRAFALLADQLQEDDQVTLIGFARTPRLLVDRVSGNSREQLLDAVFNTPSEGGTHLEGALDLAFEKAIEQQADGAQSRIIMLTDGAANLGDADPDRLATKVDAMREADIAFDAAGIGADGLNDEILEALTRKGDGRYYLLDRPEDADEGFARQIAGALRPAAMNVKVQIEFNPDRVGHYKLLGFEKHRLNKEDFRDDGVDAAEIAAEEAGVAVYQFEPLADGEGDVGTAFLRFRDMASGEMVEKSWPIPYAPSALRVDQAAPTVRLATAASLFAAKLKGDALGDSVDLAELAQVLAGLPQPMANLERVDQLRQMIEQALNLEGQ